MRKLAFVVLIAMISGFVASVAAQSRRVPPKTTNERTNQRPEAKPSPTPQDLPADDQDSTDSGEVIEVDTRLVTIPVRVLDRTGKFIGGLTQDNFKVFEDNAQQEIAYFTNEAQPFTVALVLDMSYSTVFKIQEIQSAAISFIDQLRADDRVIVISFDQEVHMLSEATSDRATIYRAIRSTRIATGTSLHEAVDMTMNERLRSIKGRKAMVLFTDGVDTTSRRSHDLENLRDAMELDALIYPIRYDTFADVQSMKNKTIINMPGSRPPGTPPIGGGSTTGLPFPLPGPTVSRPDEKGTTAKEYEHAEEYLNQLALRTGGRIYLASTFGSLTGAFSKIASELREFYSLGYYPPEEGTPGETRRIKVRVDKQNVAVKSRDGYVVPRKNTVRSH